MVGCPDFEQRKRFGGRGALAHDFQARVLGEGIGEPLAKHSVIVNQQDSNLVTQRLSSAALYRLQLDLKTRAAGQRLVGQISPIASHEYARHIKPHARPGGAALERLEEQLRVADARSGVLEPHPDTSAARGRRGCGVAGCSTSCTARWLFWDTLRNACSRPCASAITAGNVVREMPVHAAADFPPVRLDDNAQDH